jgi:hypothetical protein
VGIRPAQDGWCVIVVVGMPRPLWGCRARCGDLFFFTRECQNHLVGTANQSQATPLPSVTRRALSGDRVRNARLECPVHGSDTDPKSRSNGAP